MPEPGRVVVSEPVAPIVAVTPKLRLARDCIDERFIGTDPKIVPAKIYGRSCRPLAGRTHGPATVAIGPVEPVIEAVFETVGTMLLVAFGKAIEERLAHIRLSISISILRIEDLGRSADDHAF